MRVVMLKDHRFAKDGVQIVDAKKGEKVEVADWVGTHLIKGGVAQDPAVKRPETPAEKKAREEAEAKAKADAAAAEKKAREEAEAKAKADAAAAEKKAKPGAPENK